MLKRVGMLFAALLVPAIGLAQVTIGLADWARKEG